MRPFARTALAAASLMALGAALPDAGRATIDQDANREALREAGITRFTATEPFRVDSIVEIGAYRTGSPGKRRYYIHVDVRDCTGQAHALQVFVAGRTQLVRCFEDGFVGPLKPGRSYHVESEYLRLRGGRLDGRVLGRIARPAEDWFFPAADDPAWVRG